MKFYDSFKSPLGEIFLVFSNKTLQSVSFDKKPSLKRGRAPEAFIEQLSDYFEGKLRKFEVNVEPQEGTEFERAVWFALRDVPYGETRSYKWIAERVGTPKGSRAVGQALAKNPVPIVLPCHRVIESKGSLGGYTPGEDLKRRLLEMEYYHSMNFSGDEDGK